MSATTVSMSNCRRPQVGQAISTGPRSRSLSALRISQATLTSSSAWKVRERDADRVADAVGQQRAEADRGLQRARPLRARLGDAEVQRVGDPLAQQAVRGDRVRHVGRLDRDLEVREVEPLHQRDELDAGGDQRLDRVLALELVQVLGQRAGVDADAHRRAGGAGLGRRPRRPSPARRCCPGSAGCSARPASIAFSASVWLKWMSAMIGIGDSTTIVFSASMSLSRGTATRTMSAPASATLRIWSIVAGEVRRLGLGHRLDDDRGAAADLDAADVD